MVKKIKRIVIVGAGETAELAYEYFTHDSEYQVCAFSVNQKFLNSNEFLSLPVVVLESILESFPPDEYFVFVALGSAELNHARERVFTHVKSLGYTCASYVSSRAFVWHNVEIGENCFILENNVLQPFTVVEDNVTLWSGNHIGHRTKIGKHCFITSHCVISGFCSIGAYSFLGVNSTVADGISIGVCNFIGMATPIARNTDDDQLYRGSPPELAKINAKRFCKVRS